MTKPFRINELLPRMYELVHKVRNKDPGPIATEAAPTYQSSPLDSSKISS